MAVMQMNKLLSLLLRGCNVQTQTARLAASSSQV
jgi:hypothetical protein